MGLHKISNENSKIEKSIMDELFRNIDLKQSIVFNSGAGAGKTYALIECLKYIVNKYGKTLKDHNQHVICITYTNVAANHIKDKLGNSDIVKVSTIHERMWALISQYQKQLVELHETKVRNEIEILQDEIMTNRKFSFYRALDEEKQLEFNNIMYMYSNAFNQAYTMSATDFRSKMPPELDDFPNVLKNVGDFKSLVGKLYKIKRLKECLNKISSGEYKAVEYNVIYNQDRLEWMRISHDTVLEYGLAMVEKYSILRQIIIDQYPYVLIDEYQDTAENVIKTMNILDKYGKAIHHEFFVAYYGDMVQNIYSNGVGGKLKQIHENLVEIKKHFNRRSFQEIISVANKIRNDEIKQISIYQECKGGTIEFYSGTQTDVDNFINYYIQKWEIDKSNPLHCFFTTNQLVVQYSGFLRFYEIIKQSAAYSGVKYEQLNTELLSDEPTKLGRIPRLLHRLMHLYVGLRQERTPLREILLDVEMYPTDINSLRRLIKLLQAGDGHTLDELLKSIFAEYAKPQNKQFRDLMNIVFDVENVSYLGVKSYIQEHLYQNEVDEEKIKQAMDNLYNTSMEELQNWYQYVSPDKDEKEIIFHTYHGTKGLEFENVIIVMGKDFGIQKNFFENFFNMYRKELTGESLQLYENARNLLYVAVTRAIKNLRILYVDDVHIIEDNARRIFGEIKKVEELN